MKSCAMCEKSFLMGGTRKKLRGIYNPTNWKKKRANLQYSVSPKTGKRILLCVRCIRTTNKTKKK